MTLSAQKVGSMEMSERKREQIIQVACEQFLKFGFSKITMDEIALKLKMSKRTLYQHFAKKEELIQECLQFMKGFIGNKMDELLTSDKNVIKRFRKIFEFIKGQDFIANRAFFYDLQRAMPQSFEDFESFRKGLILSKFRSMIDEGKTQGVFRNDLDSNIISELFYNITHLVLTTDIVNDASFSFHQLADTIVKIFFEGLFTSKARSEFSMGF